MRMKKGTFAMAIKIGINGFGRIGRVILRILMKNPEKFDVCGINLRKELTSVAGDVYNSQLL